jgi:mannitol-specific phosphotransferase system IIBC component
MTVHAAVRPTRSNRSIGWVPYPLIAIVVVPAKVLLMGPQIQKGI